MSEWISVEDRLPEGTDKGKLFTKSCRFTIDGKEYSGHYHTNGCFYSEPSGVAGRTKYAESKYYIRDLPDKRVTHWMPGEDDNGS